MPIITTSEASALLQLTVATYDDLINALIPMVQSKIVRYCNNSFLNYSVQYTNSTIAFSSDSKMITDSENKFVESLFVAGDYKILGSSLNDKIVTIKTVEAGALTLEDADTLTDEVAGNIITLTRVEFPTDIKLDVAQLINYYMTKQGKLVNSESLPGGYNAQFKSESDVFLPFNKYRKPFK